MTDTLSVLCRMMKKQDTMDDGDGIEDTFTVSRTAAASAGQAGDDSEHAGGGARQACRSFSPSNLQLPADFISAQRLDRESSLEAIPQQAGLAVNNIVTLIGCN